MLTVRSFTASALAGALLAILPPQATADYTVKVDVGKILLDKWTGWGTSLCWWANVFGDRQDIADVFFTLVDSVTVEGGPSDLPGLGLNIVRYNIGGSSKHVIDDSGTEIAMKLSPSMPSSKFIESFWLDWTSSDPSSKSWDWNADKQQRTMLGLAIKRGVDVTEAFSNSPPWWMTYNHATTGGDNGNNDNLQKWNYGKFALYLATVVKHAKESWDVNFTYLEPFNEATSSWWAFPGRQEGCHFEIKTQTIVLKKLRESLDSLGLESVVIAASDENTPSLALSTLSAMDVTASIGKVNTHGYEGLSPNRGQDRRSLKAFVKDRNLKLWDSEYGEKDGTGLAMAEMIALHINEMGVEAFVYWQALDGDGWGLIQSILTDKTIGVVNTKFYVLAQYSRHIRPGMAILSTSDVNTVIAYDATSKKLVLVTVNTDKAASKVTFDLSSFKSVEGSVKAWTTETSGSGALYESSTVTLSGTSFCASIPAASVMTFEIASVTAN